VYLKVGMVSMTVRFQEKALGHKGTEFPNPGKSIVEAASCRWPEAGMPRPHFATLEIDLTGGVP
jgi:hypothetical protein